MISATTRYGRGSRNARTSGASASPISETIINAVSRFMRNHLVLFPLTHTPMPFRGHSRTLAQARVTPLGVWSQRGSGLRRLERCLSFADAPREWDDPFALVAVERLAPRFDRSVAAAGGLQHFGELAPRVSLPQE